MMFFIKNTTFNIPFLEVVYEKSLKIHVKIRVFNQDCRGDFAKCLKFKFIFGVLGLTVAI